MKKEVRIWYLGLENQILKKWKIREASYGKQTVA